MGSTVALVTRGSRTTEQSRRSVSNPFAFSVSGGKLMLSLGGGERVEIGEAVDRGEGKFDIVREGSALSQAPQPGIENAAYYACRNLLNRAKDEIGPGTRAGAVTLKAKNVALVDQNARLASQNELLMALATKGDITTALVESAGAEYVKTLPQAFQNQIVAALKKNAEG